MQDWSCCGIVLGTSGKGMGSSGILEVECTVSAWRSETMAVVSPFTSQASPGHGECLKFTVGILPPSGEESLICNHLMMPSGPKVCVQGEMPQITLDAGWDPGALVELAPAVTTMVLSPDFGAVSLEL